MFDSRRLSAAALLLLPSGLMAYFAFNAGGFYPGPPAYIAVLLSIMLAARVVGAANPFEGFGWMMAAAAALLAIYALWTLLSEHWSHAPGVALVEFDRALVYLLALVLMGMVAHTRLRLVWILRGLAIAIVVICGCALVTRLLPHVWPTSANIANNRLSFPVTYWNVLGLLAALGTVLSAHFAADDREPVPARIAGAAAVPVLACTLYFTFSRGSIAVCLIALVIYALLARPRGLVSAAIAMGPLTAVVLKVAYDADALATINPGTAQGVAQGRHVAWVLLACLLGAGAVRAALALLLDPRLARLHLPGRNRRPVMAVCWGLLAIVAIVGAAALSGSISRQYHRFLNPAGVNDNTDLRARLTDPGNNGRLAMWRIARDQFKLAPILGQGAGSFANSYAEHRSPSGFVVDAHSLYMETLDELGIVGFVALVGVILLVLVRAATRIRGPDRAMYAAVFAVLLAWALETGIDWDWEMPVVTVVFFALGGAVLARAPRGPSRQAEPGAGRERHGIAPQWRTAIGMVCLLLGVAPAYVWLSQRQLTQATSAFAAGDYRTATDAALSSISTLGIRAEAYEVLAYSDVHRDRPMLAIRAISKAVSLDPNNWNYEYGLALMRAAAGLNPLAAAHRAFLLNPKEPLVTEAWQTFRTDTPAQWQSDGQTIADAFTSL